MDKRNFNSVVDLRGLITNTLSKDTFAAMNPFRKDSVIDLSGTSSRSVDQQMGIINGLEMKDRLDPKSVVQEGLSGKGGLVDNLPVLGAINRMIHNLTFNKVQPELKMQSYLDFLKRNRNQYQDRWTARELKSIQEAFPNMDLQEQAKMAGQRAQMFLYRRSASQANWSYGGVNWARMGISKTGQGILGYLLLAPDFFLARKGFVVDALRPGGAESRWALGLGFATMFAITQGLNYAINGKVYVDPKNPDTWKEWNRLHIGKFSISDRSVQGDEIEQDLDLYNWAKYGDKPVSFEHRINPLLRPGLDLAINRDEFGNVSSRDQQLLDAFKTGQPIPVQGLVQYGASLVDKGVRQPQDTHEILAGALSALGFNLALNRTPAEKVAFREFDKLPKAEPQTDLEMEQKNTFKYLRDQYKKGTLKYDDVVDAVRGNGKYVPGIGKLRLKLSEAKYLRRTYKDSQLVSESRQLTPEPFFRVWQAADDSERKQLIPILRNKILQMPESPQKNEMRNSYQSYIDSLSTENRTTLKLGETE